VEATIFLLHPIRGIITSSHSVLQSKRVIEVFLPTTSRLRRCASVRGITDRFAPVNNSCDLTVHNCNRNAYEANFLLRFLPVLLCFNTKTNGRPQVIAQRINSNFFITIYSFLRAFPIRLFLSFACIFRMTLNSLLLKSNIGKNFPPWDLFQLDGFA